MGTVNILALCPHCGRENPVAIATGEKTEYKCMNCRGVLVCCAAIAGYIYVLSNPKMHGLLKIGFSTRQVQERVAELSSATGVPVAFEIEAYFWSIDPEGDENRIHAALEKQRVKGREF